MTFCIKKKICILFIVLLFLFAFLPVIFLSRKQPEGEAVSGYEVKAISRLLKKIEENKKDDAKGDIQVNIEGADSLSSLTAGWKEEDIVYKDWKEWWKQVGVVCSFNDAEFLEAMNEKYNSSSLFLKEDWFKSLERLVQNAGLDHVVEWNPLIILGNHTNVTDIEGVAIEENEVYTDNGRWRMEILKEELLLQQEAVYLTYDHALWAVKGEKKFAQLQNVWVTGNKDDSITYFYNNYYVTAVYAENESRDSETVSDLIFQDGNLDKVKSEGKIMNGKVVKLTGQGVEMEDGSFYEFEEDVQFYRLYDVLQSVGKNEIRLGYNFTDFIIHDGKIKAGLLVKDEAMEYIRVLIKNTEFTGNFHEEIIAWCDVDMEVKMGDKTEIIPGGKEFKISYKEMGEERIYLTPTALTGRIYFESFERNNGGQGYHGRFEAEKVEEGILLINEVLLEEYLYAVVPSEMPATYPKEALKAQAITARTYAYERMIHPGLAAYGANLDDSTGYQVYNNIEENSDTTRAVKETKGKLLFYEGEPADTYYYSTSCGMGTDGSIWNMEGENIIPYLQAREMEAEDKTEEADNEVTDIKEEENFKNFIENKDENHFEASESWYRWTYEYEDIEAVKENLISCYKKYTNYVSPLKEEFKEDEFYDGNFNIQDIQAEERGNGGVLASLLIKTDIGQIRVKNEYYIRMVLSEREGIILMHDGKTYKMSNLLPSAFFAINVIQEEGNVTGLKLTGGGFGHGAGMSQNGAKNLAKLNWNAEEILSFYYPGCEVIHPDDENLQTFYKRE